MSIISISRGSFSKGKEVAEALAAKLGYTCVSREILLEASQDFKIPELKLTRALHDAPTALDRFSYGREKYIRYFQSALLTHVSKDNVIYHGLAGHFFLQDIPHVLKVRIIANMENRVLEEMKREGCSEEEALRQLQKDDDERRRWSMQLYGRDPWDSRLYDMVLNIDTLTVDDVIDILHRTCRKEQFQSTEESIQLLKNKALLANIYARIMATSPKTKVRMVDEGVVALDGLDGWLRNDNTTRRDLASALIHDFGLKDVIFHDPAKPDNEYVNTFYNLELY